MHDSSPALSCGGALRQQHCVFLKKIRNYIQSDSHDSAPTAHCSRNDMEKDLYQIGYVSVSNKIRLNPHRPHT